MEEIYINPTEHIDFPNGLSRNPLAISGWENSVKGRFIHVHHGISLKWAETEEKLQLTYEHNTLYNI